MKVIASFSPHWPKEAYDISETPSSAAGKPKHEPDRNYSAPSHKHEGTVVAGFSVRLDLAILEIVSGDRPVPPGAPGEGRASQTLG